MGHLLVDGQKEDIYKSVAYPRFQILTPEILYPTPWAVRDSPVKTLSLNHGFQFIIQSNYYGMKIENIGQSDYYEQDDRKISECLY